MTREEIYDLAMMRLRSYRDNMPYRQAMEFETAVDSLVDDIHKVVERELRSAGSQPRTENESAKS